MIADDVRMDGYGRALKKVIDRDSVLLDIGTGTGHLAFLACKLGARHVYAIESDDIIELARGIARANGLSARMTFIQNDSRKVSLPERADVVVSDIRGVLPLLRGSIPTLIDARERLLKKGGVLIPGSDSLWLAAVQSPELRTKWVGPWQGHGLDMGLAETAVLNTWGGIGAEKFDLLSEPFCWATLDYATVAATDVSSKFEQTVITAGVGHGFLVWFDTSLLPGIGFRNAPAGNGAHTMVYGRAFFPWLRPISLKIGYKISVEIQARLIGQRYIWVWNSRIFRGNSLLAKFNQSTFRGSVPSVERLRQTAMTAQDPPLLNQQGVIDSKILAMMNGTNSLADIARQISEQYANRFNDANQAMSHVRGLAQKYGRC